MILQQFSDYIFDKNPDIIICMGDYDNSKVLQYLFSRTKKLGLICSLEGMILILQKILELKKDLYQQ